jgi:membrane-anchored protein YejM (alkaline phosphatase superfamily)
MSSKFIVIFIITLVIYFVLDYIFNNVMLYLVGGIVGGSISEILEVIGFKPTSILIYFIWMVVLIIFMILGYLSNSTSLKYTCIFLSAVLIYVIDMVFSERLFNKMESIENVAQASKYVIFSLIFIKSLILSSFIYFVTHKSLK